MTDKEKEILEEETEEAKTTEAADVPLEDANEAQDEQTEAENAEAEQTEEAADPEAEKKAEEAAESERYMRLMAEFQNFKKRTAKEKSDIHSYANEKLMNELLPVLDNFERALETQTPEVETYAKGMELIFQQMKTALENHGLKEVESLGEGFDPNKHSAVMTEESEEYETGKVCRVLQKGYELNGKVIRPAMVSVVK